MSPIFTNIVSKIFYFYFHKSVAKCLVKKNNTSIIKRHCLWIDDRKSNELGYRFMEKKKIFTYTISKNRTHMTYFDCVVGDQKNVSYAWKLFSWLFLICRFRKKKNILEKIIF